MRRFLTLLLLLVPAGAGAQTVGPYPGVFSSGPAIPKLAAGWTADAPLILPAGAQGASALVFGTQAATNKTNFYADDTSTLCAATSVAKWMCLSFGSGFVTTSDRGVAWTNSVASANTTVDTKIMRSAAGRIQIGNGSDAAGQILLTATAFASLGTPTDGTIAYCNDCAIANPCAGSGTGALAKRLAGAWVCN